MCIRDRAHPAQSAFPLPQLLLHRHVLQGHVGRQAITAVGLSLIHIDVYKRQDVMSAGMLDGRGGAQDETDPVFDRPIFIVSAPRSGSTLLFEVLSKVRDIYTIGCLLYTARCV